MKIYKKRKTAINNVFIDTYNLSVNAKIATYIETYIDCEVLAKKVIGFYKRETRKKIPTTLYLPNIINAVHHFSIDLKTEALVKLFSGGEGIRHNKTPRQLRNGYVHSKKPADAKECLENYQLHMHRMKTFIIEIKKYFT